MGRSTAVNTAFKSDNCVLTIGNQGKTSAQVDTLWTEVGQTIL